MSDTSPQPLPATCRGLVLPAAGQPPTIQNIPTPEAIPGSVVVRVLAATAEAGLQAMMEGNFHGLTMPTPYVPGSRAIGRIAATGSDTTSFKVGQLVYIDPFVRGRDNDKDVLFLQGAGVFGDNPEAIKLNTDVWRNGVFAEYARTPLENVYALNEKILLGSLAEGGLGYSIADLTIFARHLVAYGGLRDIDLKAGETIIVAPATGAYSGAAVEMASAMGARVIAVSRNVKRMEAIAANNERVNIVQLEGDVAKDLTSIKKFGPIDAYLDISSPAAEGSTHVRSCLMALRTYGRASLMGLSQKDVPVPYTLATVKSLTIKGKYMYEREHVRGIIKLIEAGVLRLGKGAGHEVLAEYPLEEWEKAVKHASQSSEPGKIVLFTP